MKGNPGQTTRFVPLATQAVRSHSGRGRKRVRRHLIGQETIPGGKYQYSYIRLRANLRRRSELLAKADLAIAIARRVEERGPTQADTARLLRTTQPRISDLRRGRLDRVSIDTLLRLLTRLGVDVELRFTPKQEETARVRVVDPAA